MNQVVLLADIMAKGEIDFAEFSPFAYVRARRKAKMTPLVSAKVRISVDMCLPH